jgi:hypothetical protein
MIDECKRREGREGKRREEREKERKKYPSCVILSTYLPISPPQLLHCHAINAAEGRCFEAWCFRAQPTLVRKQRK